IQASHLCSTQDSFRCRRAALLQPVLPSLLRVEGRGGCGLLRLDPALPAVEWGRALATSAGSDPRGSGCGKLPVAVGHDGRQSVLERALQPRRRGKAR
ncbi:unnamed protein product, partial [Urochloa humidicola]